MLFKQLVRTAFETCAKKSSFAENCCSYNYLKHFNKTEKQREVDEQTEAMKEEVRELSESAVEHFSIMAEFLANYRSGKIPANFKVC